MVGADLRHHGGVLLCRGVLGGAVGDADRTGLPARRIGVGQCRRQCGEVSSAPRWWDGSRTRTGSFSLGIVAIGCGPLIAAVVAATLRSARKFEQPLATTFDASGPRS